MGFDSSAWLRQRPRTFGEVEGRPLAWEKVCKASYSDNPDDNEADPTVMEYIELNKANGIQPVAMKTVRAATGPEREAWRTAMQVEVDSLRGNSTCQVATKEELKNVPYLTISQ